MSGNIPRSKQVRPNQLSVGYRKNLPSSFSPPEKLWRNEKHACLPCINSCDILKILILTFVVSNSAVSSRVMSSYRSFILHLHRAKDLTLIRRNKVIDYRSKLYALFKILLPRFSHSSLRWGTACIATVTSRTGSSFARFVPDCSTSRTSFSGTSAPKSCRRLSRDETWKVRNFFWPQSFYRMWHNNFGIF